MTCKLIFIAGAFVSAFGQCSSPNQEHLSKKMQNKIPDFPAGVLLQSIHIEEDVEPYGYRIYLNGRYESRAIHDQGWNFKADVSNDRLKAIQHLIAETDFETEAAASSHASTGRNMPCTWIQVLKDNKVLSVKLLSMETTPVVSQFNKKLVDIFKE